MTEPARCPSLADLLEDVATHADHVSACRRCRALLGTADLPGAVDEPTGPRAPSLGGRRRGRLRGGQVCTVGFADVDEYLVAAVIETDGADALVAPVSDEIDLATSADLLLDSGLLGYEAMAQVDLCGDVLVEQVHDVLAEMSTEAADRLGRLLHAVRDGAPRPTDVATGPAVVGEDDPRLLFRDAERERAAPFWTPADMLADARSLGELVYTRREALHLTPSDADAVLGSTGRLERLEAGALNLETEVPASALLALFRDLQVDLHEGTARLVGRAVVAAAAANPAPASPRPTGLHATDRRESPGQSTAEHRARAQRYVDALWSAAR